MSAYDDRFVIQGMFMLHTSDKRCLVLNSNAVTPPGLSQLPLRLQLWHDSMGGRLGQITEGQLAVFCH